MTAPRLDDNGKPIPRKSPMRKGKRPIEDKAKLKRELAALERARDKGVMV